MKHDQSSTIYENNLTTQSQQNVQTFVNTNSTTSGIGLVMGHHPVNHTQHIQINSKHVRKPKPKNSQRTVLTADNAISQGIVLNTADNRKYIE